MRKRVILPLALKTIRDMKADADPQFRGGTFGPKCGISHGHLCNVEAGRKQPPEELIHRIAAHLGVDVDAISYLEPIAMEAIA